MNGLVFKNKLARLLQAGLILVVLLACLLVPARSAPEAPAPSKTVFILPIREDIMPPLVYLVRRGVKEAMQAKADLLVLDMKTNGGRVDTTREIIEILGQFKGDTATYVNKDAFSAGAFISVSTKKIYMAPSSVIGAAAPIVLSPGGEGVEKTPDTYEKKMTSAVRAIVRTSAEKNGYNIAVVEAMIDKTKGLTIDGQVIAKEGEILTLTNTEAEKQYGHPPKPLLSSGTVESLDMLLEELGYGDATRHYIKPTGAEKLATWLNLISPLLLVIGVLGIYIEFKMPGVALPGIIGVIAFALYFFGGYIAGLSGMEWIVVFIIGLALVVVEIFVYPGTLAIGLLGVGLMLVALIMAMVDIYPGMPSMPTLLQLRLPIQNILYAMAGGAVAIILLSRFLPKTPVYRKIVSQSASGMKTELVFEKQKANLHGRIGVAISPLRPGGKAQFGDDVIDVISQGDLVEAGAKVRIISYSGTEAVVEVLS